MSGAKPSPTEAPFGYTFHRSDEPVSSSSYPPPGPPLLDNNESGILDSFFNNPDDVDPNFLSLQGYQADAGNMFSNTNVEWAPHGLANLSNSALAIPHNSGQMSQPEPGRQIPASADVYAAAGILHNNTARQQIPPAYNEYPLDYQSIGQQGSQLNGYGYGSMPNGATADYDFQSNNNGLYNGYDAQDSSNPYVAGMENRLQGWNGGRPSGPLNFGSDDNFRTSNYAMLASEAPDKQLVEAVNHNFGTPRGRSKKASKSRSAAQGAVRKRTKQRVTDDADEVVASNEEGESSSGEESRLKRRRKSRMQEADEDGDFEEQTSKGKKGTKKQSMTPATKSTDASAVGSSPASKKNKALAVSASKDRRENLSEEQKRSNHIQSEQKRRNLIKQGFEDLNRMVPELRSSGLSKSNMLVEAAKFMRVLRDGNDVLRSQIESRDNG